MKNNTPNTLRRTNFERLREGAGNHRITRGKTMKERPILFSAPMVRALLDGTKTQTRRIAKEIVSGRQFVMDGFFTKKLGYRTKYEGGLCEWNCPYGNVGDRLWVREDHHITLRDPRSVSVRYLADNSVIDEITIGRREYNLFTARKKPLATTRARFMWRCLSRIQLEITDVRIERLNDISGRAAWAEGCPYHPKAEPEPSDVISWYRELWESINGAGSWAANPWVWVVEFRNPKV